MSEQTFASFMEVPKIPYKIVQELARNTSEYAQNLFKMLKYDNIDALKEDNLTFVEKMELIWTPDKDSEQNKYNIFLVPLISSALDTAKAQTQIRVFEMDNIALSQYDSNIVYEIDVITDSIQSMIKLEDGVLVEKTAYMEAIVLELLNGLDIGIGSGYFKFDNMRSVKCRSSLNISNSKSLYGRSITMALYYFDNSKGGACR